MVSTAHRGWLLAVLAACLTLTLAGCLAEEAPPGSDGEPPVPPPGQQPVVTPLPAAIYLARESHLEAVFRSLPVAPEEGPRAALEALVAGPTPLEERQGYRRVLPPSVVVRGVSVRDGVASADFSREIITRSEEVGGGSRSESLALHAVYLTLVQFPGIEKVKVLVEGQSEGTVDGRSIRDFWGHVGLPEYLQGSVPVLKVVERQRVGDPAVAGKALDLKSVRWWGHPSLFRVVFEVAGRGDAPLGGVPAAEGSFASRQETVFVTIPGVKGSAMTDFGPGKAVEVNDWRVQKVAWEKMDPCSFRLTLHPDHTYGWRLWGLTDPARVVVDVYATGPSPR